MYVDIEISALVLVLMCLHAFTSLKRDFSVEFFFLNYRFFILEIMRGYELFNSMWLCGDI